MECGGAISSEEEEGIKSVEDIRNKCHASSNRCLTSSNKEAIRNKCLTTSKVWKNGKCGDMHYHPRQTSVQCTDVYKSLPTVHFGFVRFTVEPECQFTPDLVVASPC